MKDIYTVKEEEMLLTKMNLLEEVESKEEAWDTIVQKFCLFCGYDIWNYRICLQSVNMHVKCFSKVEL